MDASERNVIMVTGAAGWIGRRVCDRLGRRGYKVAAYMQSAAPGPWREAFVGGLDCLACPPEELRRLLERTRVVVHCAGRAHRPIETPEEITILEKTNVTGTQHLLAACQAAGVKRLVYVSTIAGYDWEAAPAAGITEEAALRPTSAYARTKLAAEALVTGSRLDWRVVRLATVFGIGDPANFAKLAQALKKGYFVVPGAGLAQKSIVPVDLAAEVLVRLAVTDEIAHRLMNVALPEAPTLRELCDAFSAACGFRLAPALPEGLLCFIARLGDVMVKGGINSPLTTTALAKLTTSTVIVPAKLYETFPDFPRPMLAATLQPMAEYYGRRRQKKGNAKSILGARPAS